MEKKKFSIFFHIRGFFKICAGYMNMSKNKKELVDNENKI